MKTIIPKKTVTSCVLYILVYFSGLTSNNALLKGQINPGVPGTLFQIVCKGNFAIFTGGAASGGSCLGK